MRFSEAFGIQRREGDAWFDPVLSIDTKLFVDPFLIYSQEIAPFDGSHEEVIGFFNNVFALVARTRGDRKHLLWRKAESLLIFPEAEELCLGYASTATKGAGSGRGFARIMVEALWEAVQAGIHEFSHFEEVGLLREGIGADRISDMTANLLRHRLADYTEAICAERGVPVEEYRHVQGRYSFEQDRWSPLITRAPRNPYSNKPVLLVPERYLRDLPTISSDGFWDYCWSNENETLRNDFGLDVTRNVDKKTIIQFARTHPNIRDDYVRQVEASEPRPYDYLRDPKGFVHWYSQAAEYVQRAPLALGFTTEAQFADVVERLAEEFRNYVENNGGWSLLWNDDGTAKSEEAAQRLFLGIVKHYCRANDIDLSREVNIGRGPVDFKASQGQQFRALLELKLAKNTKFWDGLDKQLPQYQKAEDITRGFFIVIVQSDRDIKRVQSIQSRVDAVNAVTTYDIRPIIVDARRNPPSASKL